MGGAGVPAWCPPVNSGGSAAPETNGSYPGGTGGAGHYASAYPSMPAPGAPVPRHGDWHCPNPACKNHTGNVVYASKTICPICGMAKPEDPETPDVPAPPTTPPPASMRRLPVRMVQQLLKSRRHRCGSSPRTALWHQEQRDERHGQATGTAQIRDARILQTMLSTAARHIALCATRQGPFRASPQLTPRVRWT